MASQAQKARVLQYVPVAQRIQAQTGVPASIILGQMALELGWLQYMPPGSNNPFGIKARPGEPYVIATTTEYIGGRKITTQAKFKKYASIEEAILDHLRVVSNKRYTGIMGSDYKTAAQVLQRGGYATSPSYARDLITTIEANNFQAYDSKTAPVQIPGIPSSDIPALQDYLNGLDAEKQAGLNALKGSPTVKPVQGEDGATVEGELSTLGTIIRFSILGILFIFSLIFLYGLASKASGGAVNAATNLVPAGRIIKQAKKVTKA